MEFAKWDKPHLRIGDEFIMGTHDAYAWLAGAFGLGPQADKPLSILANLGADLFGISHGLFGFWAPAVSGGLVAVVVVLWAWTIMGKEAAIYSGLLGALAPAHFYRSRLGYYDTDMVTLLFPLLQLWFLAHWLTPNLMPLTDGVKTAFNEVRNRFRTAVSDNADHGESPAKPSLYLPFIGGVLVRLVGGHWHDDIPNLILVASLTAVALAIICGRRGIRGRLLVGMAIFVGVGFMGLPGLVAGFAALLFDVRKHDAFEAVIAKAWVAPAAVVIAFAFTPQSATVVLKLGSIFTAYSKGVKEVYDAAEAAGPSYPAIMQSVIEAQNVDFAQLFVSLSGLQWLSVIGLIYFAALSVARPACMMILPLAVLSLFGVKFGSRFVMFGGPMVAMGISAALYYPIMRALQGNPKRNIIAAGAGLLASVAMLLFLNTAYSMIPPTPIFSKPHVLALKQLHQQAPEDSMIWTWWDWGYASMYYAKRPSFADGARQDGKYLFPLSKVMTSSSPRQAAQIMRYSAAQGYEPWNVWNEMSAPEVKSFVESLSNEDKDFSVPEKQYIVVSWENISLGYWIAYYGGWDVETGDSVHGRVFTLNFPFSIDPQQGVILRQNGSPIPYSTLDIIDMEQGAKDRSNRINGMGGDHLLINKLNNHAIMVGDKVYNSVMLQLLLLQPDHPLIKSNFKLAVEGFPFVRIYEAL